VVARAARAAGARVMARAARAKARVRARAARAARAVRAATAARATRAARAAKAARAKRAARVAGRHCHSPGHCLTHPPKASGTSLTLATSGPSLSTAWTSMQTLSQSCNAPPL
jgi:hypothetical protein